MRAAYGISWAYIAGDVAHEGYKAYCSNQRVLHPDLPRSASQERYNDAKADTGTLPSEVATGKVLPIDDYRTVMAQRAIFQSIASMGLVCHDLRLDFKGSSANGSDSQLSLYTASSAIRARHSRTQRTYACAVSDQLVSV